MGKHLYYYLFLYVPSHLSLLILSTAPSGRVILRCAQNDTAKRSRNDTVSLISANVNLPPRKTKVGLSCYFDT